MYWTYWNYCPGLRYWIYWNCWNLSWASEPPKRQLQNARPQNAKTQISKRQHANHKMPKRGTPALAFQNVRPPTSGMLESKSQGSGGLRIGGLRIEITSHSGLGVLLQVEERTLPCEAWPRIERRIADWSGLHWTLALGGLRIACCSTLAIHMAGYDIQQY